MAEVLHPDPWRSRADYDEDRRRMKWTIIAAVISSVAAVISSVAAITTAIYVLWKPESRAPERGPEFAVEWNPPPGESLAFLYRHRKALRGSRSYLLTTAVFPTRRHGAGSLWALVQPSAPPPIVCTTILSPPELSPAVFPTRLPGHTICIPPLPF
jgi:hypothetical protein